MNATLIKTEELSTLNLQPVCRLCLSQELLEDIFDHKDLNFLIAAHLSIVVGQNDDISRSICCLCRVRLYEFRDFRQRCLEVQDVLRSESIQVVKEEPLDDAEETVADARLIAVAAENLQPPAIYDEHDNSRMFGVEFQDVLPNESTSVVKEEPLDDAEEVEPFSDEVGAEHGHVIPHPTGEGIPEFAVEDPLLKHKACPQSYKCIYGCVNVSFDSRGAQNHHFWNVHNSVPFECDICDKLFQSKKMLEHHKRMFHPSGTSVCPICNLAFLTYFALENHMTYHDTIREKESRKTVDKRYKCERGCADKSYHTVADRKRHYRFAHVAEWECDLCQKVYPSRKSLRNHQSYKHTEKRFSCSLCNRTFSISSHAKQHMKTHSQGNDAC